MSRSVGADDRGSFGKTIALECRHSDGAEVALKLDVEQGASADAEAHLATEGLTNLAEDELVEESHQRLSPKLEETSAVVVLLVVCDCVLEGEVVELLRGLALLLDSAFDCLLEGAADCRHGEHHVRMDLLHCRDDVAKLRSRGLARHRGDASAVGHHGVEAGNVSEAVVHREDDEHDLTTSDVDYGSALLHIGGVVAVSKENTLRVSCGTGGVADVGVVVRTYGGHSLLYCARVLFHVLEAHLAQGLEAHLALLQFDVIHHDDLLDCRALADYAANLVDFHLGSHDEAGIRVVDTETQVVIGFELIGKRNVDTARKENSKFCDNPSRSCLSNERNLFSFCKPEGHESCCENLTFVPGLDK